MTTLINPLIERYYASTRTCQDLQLARLERFVSNSGLAQLTDATSWRKAVQLSHALHNQAYQYADKYQLSTSALAMISYLQPAPGMQTVITRLPHLPVWIETEQPGILAPHRAAAGIFFWKPTHQALSDTWVLAVVNGQGMPFLHFAYSEQFQQWGFSPLHTCPFQACQFSGWQGSHLFAEVQLHPCRNCREALDHWQAWCATALLTIQGVFAKDEDRPLVTITAIRKRTLSGSKGQQEMPIEHRYRVVSFDACIKRHRSTSSRKQGPLSHDYHGKHKLGCEVDPAIIMKVKRSVLMGTRELDPARCSRWKYKRTISVRGYEKKVPIRLDLLKERFTHVIASKYQA